MGELGQSRLSSLIEASLNTAIGFGISFALWPVAAVLFAIPYSVDSHFGVVALFTVASVGRGYAVRRWFNARLHRFAQRMAAQLDQSPPTEGGSDSP